jgi:hypothetical protein
MGKIQVPSTQNADFKVDDVTDPNGSPGRVLDLDLGFTVKGHIDFPSWMSGTANVSIYADQHGGGYNQKILSTDFTITVSGAEPTLQTIDWQATYPTNLPSGSTPLTDPSPPPSSMLYNLTAVFTFNGVPSDVGAFVEMGNYLIN